MKIKSLLIGSAAALVAATGAQAADAVVVAEPEPVEYVRVCDAYGVGFLYIPGTETCLRVSGYVWFQVAAGNYRAYTEVGTNGDTTGYYDSTTDDAWAPTTRARVNFDARSDTEWGTLRGFIRIQGTWNGSADGDGPASFDQAFIELGGWRLGYSESAWAQTQGGGASNWGSHSWGGMYYGYQQRHLLAYTFQGGNGFFGTISLEDDAAAGDGYVPDVVAKVGVNQGWGSAWVKIGWDESFEGSSHPDEFGGLLGTGSNSGGLGVGVGLQINIPNSPGSSLRLLGFYADGAHAFNAGAPSAIIDLGGGVTVDEFAFYGGGEYSILASYKHAFSSTLNASIAVQYFNDLYWTGTDVSTGLDAWGGELSVVWYPVTNFEVRAELHYDDIIDSHPTTFAVSGDPDATTSGILRFTRYF